ETIAVDLMSDGILENLPEIPNILYLVGMKFGSSSDMPSTWALNTFLPGLVARRFARSRIVALSTGNVYPLVDVRSGGATESDPPRDGVRQCHLARRCEWSHPQLVRGLCQPADNCQRERARDIVGPLAGAAIRRAFGGRTASLRGRGGLNGPAQQHAPTAATLW